MCYWIGISALINGIILVRSAILDRNGREVLLSRLVLVYCVDDKEKASDLNGEFPWISIEISMPLLDYDLIIFIQLIGMKCDKFRFQMMHGGKSMRNTNKN